MRSETNMVEDAASTRSGTVVTKIRETASCGLLATSDALDCPDGRCAQADNACEGGSLRTRSRASVRSSAFDSIHSGIDSTTDSNNDAHSLPRLAAITPSEATTSSPQHAQHCRRYTRSLGSTRYSTAHITTCAKMRRSSQKTRTAVAAQEERIVLARSRVLCSAPLSSTATLSLSLVICLGVRRLQRQLRQRARADDELAPACWTEYNTSERLPTLDRPRRVWRHLHASTALPVESRENQRLEDRLWHCSDAMADLAAHSP